jgi:hypothetical protein
MQSQKEEPLFIHREKYLKIEKDICSVKQREYREIQITDRAAIIQIEHKME